ARDLAAVRVHHHHVGAARDVEAPGGAVDVEVVPAALTAESVGGEHMGQGRGFRLLGRLQGDGGRKEAHEDSWGWAALASASSAGAKRPKRWMRVGSNSRLRMVDEMRPPRMTMAMGPSISRPGARAPSARGSSA